MIIIFRLRIDVGIRNTIVVVRGLGYLNKESLSELQKNIQAVERMLKALIKSLGKNTWTLEPLNPGSLSSNELGEEAK